MQNILRFINDDGRCFTIRILRKQDQYGDDEAFTYQEDEPSLEFFDATGFDLQDEQEILGYFTGIRCEISALFVEEITLDTPINEHLWVWNISETNIANVKTWLLANLSEIEKQFIDSTQLNSTKIPRPPAEEAIPGIVSSAPVSETKVKEVPHHTVFNQKPSTIIDNNQIHQQLIIAMHALDLAESTENNWQQGQIQLRLHLLAAKKNILRAIRLLDKS